MASRFHPPTSSSEGSVASEIFELSELPDPYFTYKSSVNDYKGA